MKEIKSNKGLSFGFSSVNAGQRNVVVEPQVVAVSTPGGFRLTPIITKLLGLESGDYVAFISNVDDIDRAIVEKDERLVAFCEENGLEISSPEAVIAIHTEFDMWGIYKGVQEFDAKGNPKTTTERLTKKDKLKFVEANFEEMLEKAMASDDEELKTNLVNTDDAGKIEILAGFVKGRELPAYTGSKCANPAGLTGIGTTLNFTDSNVWSQLKADLGDEASKVNRIYDIDVKNIIEVPVNNGYEMVTVKALILGTYEDKAPARSDKE